MKRSPKSKNGKEIFYQLCEGGATNIILDLLVF